MRRWVMRTLSMTCSVLARLSYFFEDRGWQRLSDRTVNVYNVVDRFQWKLTKRNIQRLRNKQGAEGRLR